MKVSLRHGNPFRFLFVIPRREEYLARYVMREHERGRRLNDVLADPYLRNRATPEELARLLERPDVVEALGEHALADLRLGLGRHAA